MNALFWHWCQATRKFELGGGMNFINMCFEFWKKLQSNMQLVVFVKEWKHKHLIICVKQFGKKDSRTQVVRQLVILTKDLDP
jgi:hypothetical protein